ncbi:MAG TPA: phage tail tape measure C-terminal domain-containing protein [Gallionella sp.]|nr:phage tail tape measure C-terminal domain-containing protein [Gallionella sp.]
MDEHRAILSAASNQTEHLTETEKYALKVMVDLQNGTLRLSDAQKIEVAGRLEAMLVLDKHNASMKSSLAAWDESAKVIDRARTASAEYVNQLEFENSLIGKSALEVQQLTEKRRIELALEKELLALRNDDKYKTRDTNPDVAAAYQAAVDETKRAAEATKAGAVIEIDARYRVSRAWETGTTTSVRNYLDEVSNAARQSDRLFTNAFRAMDEAGVQFVRNRKLDFSAMANSMINDLIRIQWQQNVTGPMAKAMGGSDFLSGLGGMLGFGGGSSGVGGNGVPANASAIDLSYMGFPANHEGGIAGLEATFSKMVTYNVNAQGNVARLGQAIPVLYGRHIIFPDSASSTAWPMPTANQPKVGNW